MPRWPTLDEIRRFTRRNDGPGLADEKIASASPKCNSRAMLDRPAIDMALYYGLGLEYLDDFANRVNAVTGEQADSAFRALVDPTPSRSCRRDPPAPPSFLTSAAKADFRTAHGGSSPIGPAGFSPGRYADEGAPFVAARPW